MRPGSGPDSVATAQHHHLEKLWSHIITLTIGLVDTATTPLLLETTPSGRLDATKLVSHSLGLPEIMKAYDTFENAATQPTLKVVLTRCQRSAQRFDLLLSRRGCKLFRARRAMKDRP